MGWADLHRAAAAGDAEEVRALCVAGAVVDRLDNEQRTPLHLATAAGHAAPLAALLQVGASPARHDCSGATSLHLAAAGGHAEALRLLCVQPGAAAAATARDGGGLRAIDMLSASGLARADGDPAAMADCRALLEALGKPRRQLAAAGEGGGWLALASVGASSTSVELDSPLVSPIAPSPGGGAVARRLCASTDTVGEADIWVLCPAGVTPGTVVAVEAPDGRVLEVAVPEGVAPGGEFAVDFGLAGDDYWQLEQAAGSAGRRDSGNELDVEAVGNALDGAAQNVSFMETEFSGTAGDRSDDATEEMEDEDEDENYREGEVMSRLEQDTERRRQRGAVYGRRSARRDGSPHFDVMLVVADCTARQQLTLHFTASGLELYSVRRRPPGPADATHAVDRGMLSMARIQQPAVFKAFLGGRRTTTH
jgi:hypothetical protein